jgi:hypothetical protein
MSTFALHHEQLCVSSLLSFLSKWFARERNTNIPTRNRGRIIQKKIERTRISAITRATANQ